MVDRESARSLAQKQRHLEIVTAKARNPCEGPKFSEPIKTNVEDKNIASILGNFNKIKNVMEPSHMNSFLGIPKEPPTPDDKLRVLFEATSAPNGQVKSSKSGHHAASSSSSHKDQSGAKSSAHHKNGPKSQETSKSSVKQEQATSKSRPSISPQAPLVKDGSHKVKNEDAKLNIKKEKDPHSKSNSSSKGKPNASSDCNSKPLPKDSSTPTKVKSASKTDPKPNLSCNKKDSRRLNGIINHQPTHSGQEAGKHSETKPTPVKQESVKTESNQSFAKDDKGCLSVVTKNLFRNSPEKAVIKKPDIKKERLVVPKLNIPPAMASCSEPSNLDVEKIFSMMTEIESPLTAIQNTPIKGDASSKFHFLPNTSIPKATELLPFAPPEIKPDPEKRKQDAKIKPNSPKAPSPDPDKKSSVKTKLADDLQISEDESEVEEPHKAKEDSEEQNSLSKSGTMDASRLSDSSSGSSSGESDDDSSSGNDTDSESDASSSDHEASPPPSPQPQEKTKSYNLHDLINRIRKSPGALNAAKQPSVVNPTAATSTPATPPTLTVKDSQSFPNTNQHRTTVGRKVEGSGGFVLGIKDLTTTLTPPEDYAKGNFNSYDTSNSINDFSKLLPEKRTPLPKSPVRTGGSGSKQSASKRNIKKDVDKSPLASKSKVNSQAKIEVSSKESKKDAKSVKLSKQSSKSVAESKTEVKVKSGKSTPKVDKKTPPRVRTPEKKSAKKPTSKEFVSDTDSSDSEVEIERTPCKKVNGTSKPHAVPSPAHKQNAHQTEIKCKSSSKGNRTKEKHNSLKGNKEAVLDDVFLSMIGPRGDSLFSEPLLSPIKNEDTERPVPTSHPPEITYKDGIPSLIVKLNLSLINRVPRQPRQPCRTERTSPEQSCSASEKKKLEDLCRDSLPLLVKAGKRKQGDDEEETAVKESSCKKPKTEKCAKSSRPAVAEEPELNELSSLPETDTVLDRRRPLERRNSTNSVSSLMSSNSSCSSSRKSDHEAQPTKRRKKTTGDSTDSNNSSGGANADGLVNIKGHEWGSPPPQTEERADRSQDSMSVANDVTCTRNGHRSASEEWGDYVRNSDQHAGRKNATEGQRIGLHCEESRQGTADSYLAEGKKLKRQADAQNDKNVKVLMYFDAVLSFILCGNSMENDPIVPDEKASTMYSETCDIIKFILKFQGSHLSQDALSMDKKLAVLCHRCQGLLYMKMFKMKKAAGLKFGRILGEHFKNSSKTQQNAQTPSSKYTGTPSPMSPTPSPGSVGSVCSLGSQGSNNGDVNTLQPSSLSQTQPPKLTNGMPHIMSSPASVSVPQRIVNMMSTYIQNSSYGYFGLEHWEQADVLAQENIDFFRELDTEFGTLTLHSSTLDLVRYAKLGLRKLKNS